MSGLINESFWKDLELAEKEDAAFLLNTGTDIKYNESNELDMQPLYVLEMGKDGSMYKSEKLGQENISPGFHVIPQRKLMMAVPPTKINGGDIRSYIKKEFLGKVSNLPIHNDFGTLNDWPYEILSDNSNLMGIIANDTLPPTRTSRFEVDICSGEYVQYKETPILGLLDHSGKSSNASKVSNGISITAIASTSSVARSDTYVKGSNENAIYTPGGFVNSDDSTIILEEDVVGGTKVSLNRKNEPLFEMQTILNSFDIHDITGEFPFIAEPVTIETQSTIFNLNQDIRDQIVSFISQADGNSINSKELNNLSNSEESPFSKMVNRAAMQYNADSSIITANNKSTESMRSALENAIRTSKYLLLKESGVFDGNTSVINPYTQNNGISGSTSSSLRSDMMRVGDSIYTPKNKKWARIINVNMQIDNFHDLVPTMAHSYPFELDTFQKQSIIQLESNNSVFVAAHTSAGKTVIAEYAIALSRNHMTKCIYTSPIKALSNQKFRDFRKTFDDVGLMTGDVQINPRAQCLIMTTEILRSMLYKGADMMRDVEWVIFDEIHYINDADRGVVWEEVIIMLPDHVNVVFLSATVPNTEDFAEWIGNTKQRPIYVISTLYRPVPLVHYLYTGTTHPIGAETAIDNPFTPSFHRILGNKKEFYIDGYSSAKADISKSAKKNDNTLSKEGATGPEPKHHAGGNSNSKNVAHFKTGNNNTKNTIGGTTQPISKFQKTNIYNAKIDSNYNSNSNASSGQSNNQQRGGNQSDDMWGKLIETLRYKEALPLIAFTFSKNRCDKNAESMIKLDLTNPLEKVRIKKFINKSITILKPEDRVLPQILRVSGLLLNGIGVHHAGLLPIVKEIVEILFGKGFVKVLFATETFAMGVNMPAKAVAFDSIEKFDGEGDRFLLPGEYTQMAGRAGRRGLDKTGTVIIMCKNGSLPRQQDLKALLTGPPTMLESRFKLTYNMILNLLRAEDFKVEDMMKKSFSEHSNSTQGNQELFAIEESCRKKESVQINCSKCDILVGNTIRNNEIKYKNTLDAFNQYTESCGDYIYQNNRLIELIETFSGVKSFQAGRVIIVNTPVYRNVPAVVLSVTTSTKPAMMEVILYVERALVNSISESPVCLPTTNYQFHDSHYAKSLKISMNDVFFISPYIISDPQLNVKPVVNNAKPGKVSIIQRPKPSPMSYSSPVTASQNQSQQQKQSEMIAQEFYKFLAKIKDTSVICRADPSKDLGIQELEVLIVNEELQTKELELNQFCCLSCPNMVSHYLHFHQINQLRLKMRNLQGLMSDDNLKFTPDYQARLLVLKAKKYIDKNNVVLLKGKVACELTTLDEMITTELLFHGVFTHLSSEECVAILSALLFQGKCQPPKISEALTPVVETVKKIVMDIALAQIDCGLVSESIEAYNQRLNFGLVEVVYEWARGMPFVQITGLSDVDEGTIVRCITRLDKACTDVCNACRIIGDPILHRKMTDASEKIKRDIVFAGSLYIK